MRIKVNPFGRKRFTSELGEVGEWVLLRSEESGFLGEGRSAFLEEKANELAAGK